mmetsp:Transcript_27828/g.64460  ORF Transcript_27828/g.64460 Transcript_27828/m.64460 type:complete len:112 (+) Transcript_27828:78-413(+)
MYTNINIPAVQGPLESIGCLRLPAFSFSLVFRGKWHGFAPMCGMNSEETKKTGTSDSQLIAPLAPLLPCNFIIGYEPIHALFDPLRYGGEPIVRSVLTKLHIGGRLFELSI